MVTIRDAIALIERTYPEDCEIVLAEAGLGPDWETFLVGLDPARLDVPGKTDAFRALATLTVIRDHLSRQRLIRPAVALTRALVRIRIDKLGADHPDTLVEIGAMGALADRAGRPQDAARLLRDAWDGLHAALGEEDLRVAIVAAHRGRFLLKQGDEEGAEQAFDLAYRIRKRLAPASAGQVAAQLGELQYRRLKVDEAYPLLDEAWQWSRRQFGDGDERSINRARTLSVVLRQAGAWRKAVPVLRYLRTQAQRSKDREALMETGFELGVILDHLGEKAEGFRLVDEATRAARAASREETHPDLARRITTHARMVAERGRGAEAEGLLLEALELERSVHGPVSPEAGRAYVRLGVLFRTRGRVDEALGWLDTGASLLRSARGDDHFETRRAVEQLCEALQERVENARLRGDRRLARDYLTRALSLASPILGADHPLTESLRVTVV